jgi:antitoxin CptB
VIASTEIRRKRLLYRSWHRGTRESDLILGRFAGTHLAGFDDVQLDRYEALLGCADADLFDWVAGRAAPPAAFDHDVMCLLLAFTNASSAECSLPEPSPLAEEGRAGMGGGAG